MQGVMENKKSTNKGLSIFERFAYGCGDFGCNIIYTAMSVFLLKYYVDYAGVSAAAVGTIMLISRLFDGVSDLIMGIIVDRTKSKHGKARPWILRMAIPFAVSGILLFAVPTSWGTAAKCGAEQCCLYGKRIQHQCSRQSCRTHDIPPAGIGKEVLADESGTG